MYLVIINITPYDQALYHFHAYLFLMGNLLPECSQQCLEIVRLLGRVFNCIALHCIPRKACNKC